MSIQGSAVFNDGEPREYRHRLDRWWSDEPRALVLMANPSIAGADKNDPTIHNLIRLVRLWNGCGGFTVVNYEPYIATDPNNLRGWQAGMSRFDPDKLAAIRAENLLLIRQLSADAWIRIVAWGDIVPSTPHSDRTLAAASLDRTQSLYAFGFTKSGSPKHPLARGKSRIPDGARPAIWRHVASPAQAA
jgi:hypothetical protein